MKNTFRIPVIILMLIVSAISHSASARSEVDAIEEEYNRMEAEYRTKLEQIDRNISETRNNIAEMQSDPMHSESKLDSEIKWLEILESDRVRISGTLSSLQAQKQQAIQTQINIEKGVAEAAKKAQREKQIADQQKRSNNKPNKEPPVRPSKPKERRNAMPAMKKKGSAARRSANVLKPSSRNGIMKGLKNMTANMARLISETFNILTKMLNIWTMLQKT